MNDVSPLAPERFPDLPAVAGVTMATGQCKIKSANTTDVLLVELTPGTVAAAVFTKSMTAAASVEWCRNILPEKEARGLVVNSGNANAFTGQAGVDAVNMIAGKAAELIGSRIEQIFVAQTGVIGEPIPVGRITKTLPQLHAQLGAE